MDKHMQIRKRDFALSLIAAMLMGSALTGALLYGLRPAAAPVSALLSQSDLAKVQKVYSLLKEQYYAPIDRDKVVEGAITGMVQALGDPYTTYMSPEEAGRFHESISGSFEGIGAELREEGGHVVVVSPIHGSPAEKAGLKPNDIILEVNGFSLKGVKISEAVPKIRGPKGTTARLLIQRPGLESPFELSIVRDTIPIETVYAKMLPNQIGHVQVTKFSEQTPGEFDKALTELKAQGARGIILDLRQNPGGLLSAAIEMAEFFVPKDQPILQVKHRTGRVEQYRSQGRKTDLPAVVLIDRGSASAAEILAGALKESAGVPLIGETSFGKGTVQSASDMEDGATLKYTTAEWLTPKGNQVNNQGIKPDVAVSLPDYANLPYVALEHDQEYRQGDRAEAIRVIQAMLKVLGYDPGREDGLLDQSTASTLKAFQAAMGLAQTGTVNQVTANRAAEQLRAKVRENDTQLLKAQEMLRELMQK